MSLETTDGASWLSRTTLPTQHTISGWFKGLVSTGTEYEAALRSSGSGPFYTAVAYTGDEGTVDAWAGIFTSGGDDLQALGSTFFSTWTFVAIVVSSTTISIYTRKEGDTSLTLQATFARPGGSTSNLWSILSDTNGSNCKAGCLATSIKAYSVELTTTEIMVESWRRAPVRTSGIYSYLSCGPGSTIGDDESGNNNDWTIDGSGLALNADEPTFFSALSEWASGASKRAVHAARQLATAAPVGALIVATPPSMGWQANEPARTPFRASRAPESGGVVGARITTFAASSVGFLPSDSPRGKAPARASAESVGPVGQPIRAAFGLSCEPAPRGRTSVARAESVAPIGAPFPFAPVPFQQWTDGAPRSRWRTGPRAADGWVPGAPFAPSPAFSSWTSETRPRPISPARVVDSGAPGARLVPPSPTFVGWSVEARGNPPRPVRAPEPVELGARIIPTAPVTFQTWSVEAGRLPVVPRRVSPPTELGPSLGFAPTPFVAWSVESRNPVVPPRRAPEPTELGARITAPQLSALGWEPTSSPRAPVCTAPRVDQPTPLPALVVQVSAGAWLSVEPPRAAALRGPGRADSWSPLSPLLPALSSSGWLADEPRRARSLPTRRAQDPTELGALLPVVVLPSIGWMPSDAPVSRFPRRPELNPDAFVPVRIASAYLGPGRVSVTHGPSGIGGTNRSLVTITITHKSRNGT